MATAKVVNRGSTISPKEAHQHRFVLYMITYLLCTPSALAEVVHDRGDLDMFLRSAGIDKNEKTSRTREICLEFVNQIKTRKTLWALMNGIQATMDGLLNLPSYDPPPCPNSMDVALLLKAANAINPNGDEHCNGSTVPMRARP